MFQRFVKLLIYALGDILSDDRKITSSYKYLWLSCLILVLHLASSVVFHSLGLQTTSFSKRCWKHWKRTQVRVKIREIFNLKNFYLQGYDTALRCGYTAIIIWNKRSVVFWLKLFANFAFSSYNPSKTSHKLNWQCL